jgi:hypothetical protein
MEPIIFFYLGYLVRYEGISKLPQISKGMHQVLKLEEIVAARVSIGPSEME